MAWQTRSEPDPHCRYVHRIALAISNSATETEKYAHVTFFFNGGVERQFDLEDRFLIDSPKVATYDLQPEMSVNKVAEKVASIVQSQEYDFVMCNFAPPDMVGHTGKYDAAVKAISETDKAVKTVYEACKEAGYVLAVTADHGNAEQMINPDTKAPHTAHTTNPVPFILTLDPTKYAFAKDDEKSDPGALCDVAPTILALMVSSILTSGIMDLTTLMLGFKPTTWLACYLSHDCSANLFSRHDWTLAARIDLMYGRIIKG